MKIIRCAYWQINTQIVLYHFQFLTICCYCCRLYTQLSPNQNLPTFLTQRMLLVMGFHVSPTVTPGRVSFHIYAAISDRSTEKPEQGELWRVCILLIVNIRIIL